MRALYSIVGLMTVLALGVSGAVQTGPEAGAKLPDFQLPDQSGKMRTLSSLMGPKGLVLVVYRSADW